MTRALLSNLVIVLGLSVSVVACTATSSKPSASTSSTPQAAASSPTSAASPTASTVAASTPASSSPTTAKPTDSSPDVVRVSVINNSGKTLNAVYLSPPTKKIWGQNEITEPLPDRGKADFEWKRSDYKGVEAGCLFEVRVEYADGKDTELDAMDICKTPAINLN